MQDHIKSLATAVLGAMTFVDTLDFTMRVLAGIASIAVAYWAIRSYRVRVKLDEEKLKQIRKDEN